MIGVICRAFYGSSLPFSGFFLVFAVFWMKEPCLAWSFFGFALLRGTFCLPDEVTFFDLTSSKSHCHNNYSQHSKNVNSHLFLALTSLISNMVWLLS